MNYGELENREYNLGVSLYLLVKEGVKELVCTIKYNDIQTSYSDIWQ